MTAIRYGQGSLALLNNGALGPRAIIIRHADRDDIPSVTQSLGVGLNDRGREDARMFGGSIAGRWTVRLFHSPAVRCRETAELIAEGLRSNGSQVSLVKETWNLCAPYLKDQRTLKVADELGHGFMRAWFDGKLDPAWVLPTPQAADMVLAPILGGLREGGSDKLLDIHVSHDWEVVLLREELFGTRHEEGGWIDYLDGIMFTDGGAAFKAWKVGRTQEFAFATGRRA